jgi:DNA mismatch endonuclease (patch repair protein)
MTVQINDLSFEPGHPQPPIPDPANERRDHLTPAQRSSAMAKVHRRDTSAELRLRRALWQAGVRGWRCDVGSLPGRPDLAFTRWRVAVFVDGLLWHGHPKRYPASLSTEWRQKIATNVARDRRVDRALNDNGWTVVRVWDSETKRDISGCVERVLMALAARGASIDGKDPA